MADLSWAAALVGASGGGGAPGKSITSAKITEAGELEISFSDGTTKNVGHVVGADGRVYVPRVDEHKILTFTIEDKAGEVPEPVDLDAADEWKEIDSVSVQGVSAWKEI